MKVVLQENPASPKGQGVGLAPFEREENEGSERSVVLPRYHSSEAGLGFKPEPCRFPIDHHGISVPIPISVLLCNELRIGWPSLAPWLLAEHKVPLGHDI